MSALVISFLMFNGVTSRFFHVCPSDGIIMVIHHASRCQKHYEHLEIKENKDRKGYSVLLDHALGRGMVSKIGPNSVVTCTWNIMVPFSISNADHEISLINRT